jgi:hypothetical protein
VEFRTLLFTTLVRVPPDFIPLTPTLRADESELQQIGALNFSRSVFELPQFIADETQQVEEADNHGSKHGIGLVNERFRPSCVYGRGHD